jgi:hypothetical protein
MFVRLLRHTCGLGQDRSAILDYIGTNWTFEMMTRKMSLC